MIAGDFKEAPDESEVNIIRKDQQGLSQVDRKQWPTGKQDVRSEYGFLFAEKVDRDKGHVQQIVKVFLTPDHQPLEKHVE